MAKLDLRVRRTKCLLQTYVEDKSQSSHSQNLLSTLPCLMQVSLDHVEMSGLLAPKVHLGCLEFRGCLVDMGYKGRRVSMARFLEHLQANLVTKGYRAFRELQAKLVIKEIKVIRVSHDCIILFYFSFDCTFVTSNGSLCFYRNGWHARYDWHQG